VERLFDTFTRRDLDAFLDLVHPDVELVLPTAEVAREGRPYLGADGVREYFEDAASIYDELRLIPQLIAEREGCLVVIGRVYARGTTGITDTAAGWVLCHADARVTSLHVYTNRQQALAAGEVTENDLEPL
jgi:ketosteroid isomerase-like protein